MSEESFFNPPLEGRTTPDELMSPHSIAIGLRAAAEEVSSSRDRSSLNRLAETIQSGRSLEEVLANDSRIASDLKAVIQAGVSTGRLPHLLEAYLSSRQSMQSVWRKFYLSLLYPLIMVVLAALISITFVIIVIPTFKEIFMDFGVELPRITEALIGLADFIVAFGPGLFIAMLIVLLLVTTDKLLPFRVFRARVFQKLPIIGQAQEFAASSEFCSRMAVLVDCRLPLDESLRITSMSLRDPYLSAVAKKIAIRVEAGETNDEIARHTPAMHHALANSFRWAKDPESYADGLRSLAIVFAARARAMTSQIAMLIEPLTVVAIGLSIGFAVVGLFMPLIKLLNELA